MADEVGILIKIKGAAKAIAEVDSVKKSVSRVADVAKQANHDLARMAGQGSLAFANAGRGISSLASSMAQYSRYSAVAGAAGLAFGLKTAGGLEGTNIAFKTLLGSQELATKKIQELQDFAAATPFQFTDVVQNAQRLLAQGFGSDELVGTLTAVGDAAAGLNAGQDGIDRITLALGQMRQAGKVNATDLRQLTEVGVDGWGMLADAAGVSTAKMMDLVSQGVVPGMQATNVLIAGLEKRYGGIMKEQSKTFLGQISNMVDKTKANLLKIDKDGKMTGTLAPLVIMLERNMPRAAALLDKAMAGVGRAVLFVTNSISAMARGYKDGGMNGLVRSLGNILGVGDSLLPVWAYIRDVSKSLAEIWKGSLWPAIKDVASIMGPFVGGALKSLEAVLHWMAEHPDVARVIFVGLGLALTEYAIITTLMGVAGAIRAVAAGFVAANLAVAAFPIGAAKAALGMGGAEAAAVAAAPAATGFAKYRVATAAAPAVVPLAEGAAATGAAGLAVPAAAGAAGVGFLFKNFHDTYSGINKHFRTFGRFAKGGVQSVGGPAIVGEEGIEIADLPGGSQVHSNRDLKTMLKNAGKGTTVVFGENSLVINGADYLQTQRFADAMIQEINNRIARS
jgi:tape measure domain-containing protein